MNVNLIWAQARGGVIGLNGQIPWHLPEDLAHFKRTTLGAPVIMGRKTWDSLPQRFRPLPGRLNFVVSRDLTWGSDLDQTAAQSSASLEQALSICEQAGQPLVWVIGGGQLYAQAMPLAHELWVTEIDAQIEADTFAPEIGPEWVETSREQHTAANGWAFSFVSFGRA